MSSTSASAREGVAAATRDVNAIYKDGVQVARRAEEHLRRDLRFAEFP